MQQRKNHTIGLLSFLQAIVNLLDLLYHHSVVIGGGPGGCELLPAFGAKTELNSMQTLPPSKLLSLASRQPASEVG